MLARLLFHTTGDFVDEQTTRTGIITLVDRKWTDRWQAEANLLSRLAERYEIVWVEPGHHWRMTGQEWRSRRANFLRPSGAAQLQVYSPPIWLSTFHRPVWLRRLVLRSRLRAVRRHLVRSGCDRIVLYVWRPKHLAAIDLIDYDAAIYHLVDEYSFSEADLPTTEREHELLSQVDQVIVHSPALLEKKGSVNPNTAMIPNGVDFSWFAEPCPEPEDLSGVGRPRIGYCGYVKRQLDWNLIQALVARHSEWNWVFVGKVSPHPELASILAALEGRPNVYFLGAKSTRELAMYPQHFDVCIMPYKIDGYTKYISPLKLNEYLASGRPTVGSPIRTLLDFAHVVTLVDGVDDWSQALERALGQDENAISVREARQAVAREFDWKVLVDRVAEQIELTLERTSGN